MPTPTRRQSRLQSIPGNTLLGRRSYGSSGKGDVQILAATDAAYAMAQTGIVGGPGPSPGAAIADGDIISNISGVLQSPKGNTIVATLAHVFGTATTGAVLSVVSGAWASGLLTVLGTVTSGVWNGTKIALGFGGTGADLSATGGASQVLKQSSAGAAITVGQLAFTDISGRATSAQIPTDVAYLDVLQSWTAVQTFGSSDLKLAGATSGAITLNAAAVAGTNTITLPAVTGTVVTTADTGTVTSTMILDGTITGTDIASATVANANLVNSSITLGSTAVSLGATASSVTGLTLSGGTLSGTTTIPGSGAIDSSGNILTGFASVLTIGGGTAQQYQQVNTNAASMVEATFQAGGNGSGFTFAKSRGSTSLAGAVVSGDLIGFLQAIGDDGSANAQIKIKGANQVATVDAAVSTGIVPMRWQWGTMNAAGTFAERMRLTSAGGLAVGTTTDPGSGNITANGTVTANTVGSNLGDQLLPVYASTAELDATSNTTLANVTGLSSITMQAGTYVVKGHLSVSAGASGGIKVSFQLNTTHITSMSITSVAYAAGALQSITTVTTSSSNSAIMVAQTAAITDIYFEGAIVTNASSVGCGIAAAQNASNATTTKVLINSDMFLMRVGG